VVSVVSVARGGVVAGVFVVIFVLFGGGGWGGAQV
jgi:hypothetical protein